jgi:acetyl-CoA C-acetyltransferase
MNDEIVIIDAVRTPIGKFQGRVSQFSATELGAQVIKALKERNNLTGDEIDEVILGNVVQAGNGQAPARQAVIHGGLSSSTPAVTINKVCGSGLKAVINGAQAIKCGDASIIIAGGMESMSNAPYIAHGARAGFRFGDKKFTDAMIHDGLWDAFEDHHMGNSAEYTANKAGVTRLDQDQLSLCSHQKAVKAYEEGHFSNELIPLEDKKGIIDRDESIREDTTLEVLGGLRTAFVKDGSVTAGNAPGLNDGASAILITSAKEAEKRGWTPLAKIVDYAVAGTDPIDLFFAPIKSTEKLIEKMGVGVDHFELIEVNEAFAAQVAADGKALGWDWDRVNVNGGAIALGHPIGSSGSRILGTLVWAMKNRGAKTGLATICMGGGNGLSLAVEAV